MLRKTSKRPFLLFELLFSLALVAICLIPLIKPHVGIQKMEQSYLKAYERQRLSQNAFCQLKTELYEGKYSFEELSGKKALKGVLATPFEVHFPSKKTIPCHYQIFKEHQTTKKGTKNTALLLTVHLFFDNEKEPFIHTLFAERREIKE